MEQKSAYVGIDGEKFFQYTMIDKASRERFIYAYREQSSHSIIDFTKRAILYFGYAHPPANANSFHF